MSEFVSHRAAVAADIGAAVRRSFGDVLVDAGKRSHAGHIAASGKVEQLGPTKGRVIFRAPDAIARERGAYITPRNGRALKFADGRFSMHARLPKRPYLAPAAQRWGAHLLARLREVT